MPTDGDLAKVLENHSTIVNGWGTQLNAHLTAEMGSVQMDLRSLERLGLLPANLTDDQRARYMYYAHHEGLGGAARLLTDSRTATEAQARGVLELRLGARGAAALARQHEGSYREAFRVWTEAQARYLFPTQVAPGRAGQRVIDRYVAQHGDYEHGYRAWLEEYTARQVRPENYRR